MISTNNLLKKVVLFLEIDRVKVFSSLGIARIAECVSEYIYFCFKQRKNIYTNKKQKKLKKMEEQKKPKKKRQRKMLLLLILSVENLTIYDDMI